MRNQEPIFSIDQEEVGSCCLQRKPHPALLGVPETPHVGVIKVSSIKASRRLDKRCMSSRLGLLRQS